LTEQTNKHTVQQIPRPSLYERMASNNLNHKYIISGFDIYGAAVVPDSGVGNTWQRLTLALHEFLSNGLTPSRLHIVMSFLTHADHVFLGLPRSLVPGSPNRVMALMHEVARCMCPYHLRRRVRRTAVISSRSSFLWIYITNKCTRHVRHNVDRSQFKLESSI